MHGLCLKNVNFMVGKQSRGGNSFLGDRSFLNAIHKMERRLRRSERKISEKKLLVEFGVKAEKLNHRHKKISSSSLSFDNIRNRNSILFKRARKAIDIGTTLGVKFQGGRNFNLKKFVEMQEDGMV